jgi:hypothetical protein
VKLALVLLQLHGTDGGVITVNPDQITSMREARDDASGKHFAANLRCMISLADGKFVAVVEECGTVRKMVEDK